MVYLKKLDVEGCPQVRPSDPIFIRALEIIGIEYRKTKRLTNQGVNFFGFSLPVFAVEPTPFLKYGKITHGNVFNSVSTNEIFAKIILEDDADYVVHCQCNRDGIHQFCYTSSGILNVVDEKYFFDKYLQKSA